jgi:hypothetical protein
VPALAAILWPKTACFCCYLTTNRLLLPDDKLTTRKAKTGTVQLQMNNPMKLRGFSLIATRNMLSRMDKFARTQIQK